MRHAAALLFVLALVTGGLAYWGMFTAGGARQFDEMAGMIPFFAGIASAVLTLAGFGAWLLARARGG